MFYVQDIENPIKYPLSPCGIYNTRQGAPCFDTLIEAQNYNQDKGGLEIIGIRQAGRYVLTPINKYNEPPRKTISFDTQQEANEHLENHPDYTLDYVTELECYKV